MPCQAGVARLSPGPRRSRCGGQGLQPQGCTRVNPRRPTAPFVGAGQLSPALGPCSRPRQLLSVGSAPFKSERRCRERHRRHPKPWGHEGSVRSEMWLLFPPARTHCPPARGEPCSSPWQPRPWPAPPPGRGTGHGAALHRLSHQHRPWQARGEGCSPPRRCQSHLQRCPHCQPGAAQPGHNPAAASSAQQRGSQTLQTSKIFSPPAFL